MKPDSDVSLWVFLGSDSKVFVFCMTLWFAACLFSHYDPFLYLDGSDRRHRYGNWFLPRVIIVLVSVSNFSNFVWCTFSKILDLFPLPKVQFPMQIKSLWMFQRQWALKAHRFLTQVMKHPSRFAASVLQLTEVLNQSSHRLPVTIRNSYFLHHSQVNCFKIMMKSPTTFHNSPHFP